jgi:hypothetical protein
MVTSWLVMKKLSAFSFQLLGKTAGYGRGASCRLNLSPSLTINFIRKILD